MAALVNLVRETLNEDISDEWCGCLRGNLLVKAIIRDDPYLWEVLLSNNELYVDFHYFQESTSCFDAAVPGDKTGMRYQRFKVVPRWSAVVKGSDTGLKIYTPTVKVVRDELRKVKSRTEKKNRKKEIEEKKEVENSSAKRERRLVALLGALKTTEN